MMKSIFYFLTKYFLRIYFAIFHSLTVRGRGALSDFLASHRMPVILAANHESYLDPPLIGAVYPERLRFVAWDHLFDSKILAALITPLGAVPVSQENKASAAGLLRQVMGFLDDGMSVLIFPEGHRSEDGRLQPLEGGVALMSAKTGLPIVPIWIDGTFEAYPPHQKYPHPGHVVVTFGEPIFPLPQGSASDKERRADLLERLNGAFIAMRDGGAPSA